jgi:hypothetical protein
MTKIQEAPETTVSETESIIRECREKIWQALEVDGNKLKERAETESSQILARAKEEAESTLAQTRQEIKAESERLLAEAQKEAEQIIKRANEEAVQSRQKSTRILSETRLLTQLSKSLEQVIGESETDIAIKLEHLVELISEAKAKLPFLGQLKDKEAEVSVPAKKEAASPAASAKKKVEPDLPSQLFKGQLKLEVLRPFAQERLTGVPDWLAQLPGLNVITTGCYAGANRWITTYTVDLEFPMPLLEILKAVPAVIEVSESKGAIVISMK